MSDFEPGLVDRLGLEFVRKRLAIERGSQRGYLKKWLAPFVHAENWYSGQAIMRRVIQLSGMYGRGQRNAANFELRENCLYLSGLPNAFDGYRILQISDLHIGRDTNLSSLIERLSDLRYEICVLTGDFCGEPLDDMGATLEGMRQLMRALRRPVYGVLGNHDPVHLVPALEGMGVVMLVNECVALEHGGARVFLAGVDDPHYFRLHDLAKAASSMDKDSVSLLLAHTPDIFREAQATGFDVMLCGHTHGGQICLPGGTPLILDASCPRHMGAGSWKYCDMQGYTSRGVGTSIVNVRFNCLPEMTIHHLAKI